jgi:hypothetical protein
MESWPDAGIAPAALPAGTAAAGVENVVVE